MQDLIPTNKIQKLAELDRQYNLIKEQRDALRAELLELTQELDVYQLKTGSYTLYRAKRITPKVESFKTLKASLEAQNIPYETMEVFTPQMMLTFREIIKKDKQLEGLSSQETEYVSIRQTKKGGKDE